MSIQCHDTVVSIRKYIRLVKTVMRCWCSGVNDWIWSCHCHPMIYLSGTDLPTHKVHMHARTHTRLTAICLSLPGTRKVKPIWILLKQETVSGSGISWAIWKSAPRSRQITTSAPHYSSFFYRPDALPVAQPTASKHWRQSRRYVNRKTQWCLQSIINFQDISGIHFF